MAHKKFIVFLIAVFLLIAAAAQGVNAVGGLVDQPSTLNGKVSVHGLAATGSGVREGQPLLSVDGIAGAAVAARATVSGTVAEVLVKPGDTIKSGQIIARIKPSA